MRTRAKALTVAASMVLTFAILPTFGAAAAEPLQDGSYDVVIDEVTYTVDVVEGVPTIEGADGVEFTFAFDEETNRVLDEFDVAVGGVTYDVAVADDGTVTVTAADEPDDDPTDDGEGEEPTEVPEGDGEGEEPAEDDEDEQDDDQDVEALEEGDDETVEDGDDGHGEVVSTVAQCAPNGKEAREAGLPNHGFFVRAAAKGEQVEFELDGVVHSADLSTQEGADTFCTLAEDLLAAAAAEAEATAADADADDDADGAGGKGKGRAGAPGQAKKNG